MSNWIIIVDDDRANLKMAGHVLSKKGIRVSGVTSGQALLDYLKEKGMPDLILLDINMKDMDGFETLKRLRELEAGQSEVPVIFLTADENEESESRALQVGAVDYIRKPFEPAVLMSRVKRTLDMQDRLHRFEQDAKIDTLTQCLNRGAVEEKLEGLCRDARGFLCVLDLDAFKLVNDLCGHDVGDEVLRVFAHQLQNSLRSDDVCGRIGGDEFIVFARNMKTERELANLYQRINDGFSAECTGLLGKLSDIPLGVSLGAAAVPWQGRDYSALFHLADQALSAVKKDGKHGWKLSGQAGADGAAQMEGMDLETATAILSERNISQNAMWMGQEAFVSIYRYMVRYMERYHGMAYRVLFTVEPIDSEGQTAKETLTHFRQMLQHSLRNSDVMMEVGENKLFLLLPEAHDYDIDRVVARLLDQWGRSEHGKSARITYETGQVHLNRKEKAVQEDEAVCRIAVVDDDESNLKVADRILRKENMLVTSLKSGRALLEYVKVERPDLILLDILMPDMDGFETMRRLKQQTQPGKEIPVIFLTADENRETEVQALRMGALDIIRKPMIPEALTLRVRHTIELARLQRNLAAEVERKTRENELLSLHVVRTLAGAIDAKDTYTNGHSERVAKYAREIARRVGYDEAQQDSIYMSGLLHDVGKIGVSDAIINKPAKLTDEEYAIIKTHPVMGARILQNIQERPDLAVGARWHHERYDGSGYPDGLAGNAIPDAARIIAVADAYDAMTSRRSYRDTLSQSVVRSEIEKGRGTQFDPRFASVMLDMIDEDTEYDLREKYE